MNILYLTNHLNIGGITSYVLSLSAGLGKRGHNIYVASSDGETIFRFSSAGVTYIRIPLRTKSEVSPKVLVSLMMLKKPVEKYSIDVIHSNSRVTQVLGCLAKKYFRRPHISTCHGFFRPKITRRMFPCWGDKVIAISEQVRQHLIDDFQVADADIRVINNGIDCARFSAGNLVPREEAKNKLGLRHSPVVSIIARLSDVKGHLFLIEAMKQVLAQVPDAQLLIVGEGRMGAELVKLSKRLGIEKNIVFIPRTDDTREILAATDVFVMPSLKEGLGLGLMEAMASAIAVVGSDVGGIKSLIQNGENGLLVAPKDVTALGSAILRLLRDREIRSSFGAKARQFISKNFSLEEMVLKTERVYLECLKESE